LRGNAAPAIPVNHNRSSRDAKAARTKIKTENALRVGNIQKDHGNAKKKKVNANAGNLAHSRRKGYHSDFESPSPPKRSLNR
jgi:hypothetical protein